MNEYGKKIASALQAIRLMHSDTAHLLRDCEQLFKTKYAMRPLFKPASIGLGPGAPVWMPLSVEQVYVAQTGPWDGRAVGVMAAYFDIENSPTQPLFVVCRFQYRATETTPETISRNDPWWNTPKWTEMEGALDQMRATHAADLEKRLESTHWIARPLFEISSVNDVEAMCTKLGC